ncbi:MAG: DsrE/DsrF/DrsH-like family protein, partial [Proteobacteria bacterium]|nr:DsrE/DsrF/DrsH-like family protein [Pseudomonadota bacterium]MBU1610590.1 DsrE/DsrF/DrsH-like family protein [Pseudomonadota bacterium]
IACHMTMGMMKLTKEDLIDGVEIMTAEEYLKLAGSCSVNMFT